MTSSARLDGVARVAFDAGAFGVTWQEVADTLGLHHGQASGALSRLHRDGTLLRLSDRRGKSSVYVAPGSEGDRPVVAPRQRVATVTAAEVDAAYQRGLSAADEAWLSGYKEGKGVGVDEGRKLAEAEMPSTDMLSFRYSEGRDVGRREVRDNAVRVIDELVRSLTVGRPVHIHTKVCWRTRPECALLVARKTLMPNERPRIEYDDESTTTTERNHHHDQVEDRVRRR